MSRGALSACSPGIIVRFATQSNDHLVIFMQTEGEGHFLMEVYSTFIKCCMQELPDWERLCLLQSSLLGRHQVSRQCRQDFYSCRVCGEHAAC